MTDSVPSAFAAAMSASMDAADGAADAAADAAAEAATDAAADGAATDAAADGLVEAPDDEQAANTKLATTTRPAMRVMVRCVDKVHPPLVLGFPIAGSGDLLFPGMGTVSIRPPVWRTSGLGARSPCALDIR